MTRGRDRTADRSRDRRVAEDHKAAGTKNDQPTAHPCAENRKGMEGEQGVGKYEGAIREYIQNRLKEDIMNDQISLKEYVDPFTGVPVKQGK